eukprot:scaffold618_cov130-Cylindrotheca_fusiformis.AAC.20
MAYNKKNEKRTKEKVGGSTTSVFFGFGINKLSREYYSTRSTKSDNGRKEGCVVRHAILLQQRPVSDSDWWGVLFYQEKST